MKPELMKRELPTELPVNVPCFKCQQMQRIPIAFEQDKRFDCSCGNVILFVWRRNKINHSNLSVIDLSTIDFDTVQQGEAPEQT